MSPPKKKLPDNPLAKAIYGALSGQVTGLDGSVVPVYDGLPRDGSGAVTATEPFIKLGEIVGTDKSTNTTTGHDSSIRIHAWSAYNGRKEAGSLISQISEILHRRTFDLSADGHSCYFAWVDNHRINEEPDEASARTLRHAVIEIRYLTTVNA